MEFIEVRRPPGLRLFLDLNETLIRTGEVRLETRREEQRQLETFVAECRRLARGLGSLQVVFVTGNSFEYSRRIEEPLGLKHVPGVELTVVSENGLLARSFRRGDLWRAEPVADYRRAVGLFLRQARQNSRLGRAFYSQGNELRTTLKPVANAFTPEQLAELGDLARTTVPGTVALVYSHRFYFDLDPVRVILDGREVAFEGKRTAAQRLIAQSEAYDIAVGDSVSDLPLFDAVVAAGGRCFWVGNAPADSPADRAQRLVGHYTAGVNEVLTALRVKAPAG